MAVEKSRGSKVCERAEAARLARKAKAKAWVADVCAEPAPVPERARAEFESIREALTVPAPASDIESSEEPKRLTRWIADGERCSSGHRPDGQYMTGSAWLLAECAAHRKRGRKVSVVRHATLKGHRALFLD